MKIILFSIPGSPPIIANLTDDKEDTLMIVEYPVLFLKEDSAVYTMPYMPLAKNGIVAFNRNNIVSFSSVDSDVEIEYKKLVAKYRLQKNVFFKEEDQAEEQAEEKKQNTFIKSKVLH